MKPGCGKPDDDFSDQSAAAPQIPGHNTAEQLGGQSASEQAAQPSDPGQINLGVSTPLSTQLLIGLLRRRTSPGRLDGRLRSPESYPCRAKIVVQVKLPGPAAPLPGALRASPDERTREFPATTENISIDGLALTCRSYIPPGSTVRLRFDLSGADEPLTASVKSCAATVDGQYLIDVHFGAPPGSHRGVPGRATRT